MKRSILAGSVAACLGLATPLLAAEPPVTGLWPAKKVLISPLSAREIDWAKKLVHLDVDRQRVKDSPAYDPAVTVDRDYDEKFLTYYGIKWVAK